jgi:hypothetical protein
MPERSLKQADGIRNDLLSPRPSLTVVSIVKNQAESAGRHFSEAVLKMCALRPACRLSHKQERCRSPLRQIARKKVRYLTWKVKSTSYDASVFFAQADLRGDERQMVETRGPLRVEHSIRLKAAPTPFVQNKAE